MWLAQVWSAISGALLRRYKITSRVDLTTFCLDGRKRKFITGDHDGNVEVCAFALSLPRDTHDSPSPPDVLE